MSETNETTSEQTTEKTSKPEEISLLSEERDKLILAVRAVQEKKALDVMLIDVTDRQTYTDYILICHGQSDRQVQAIAEHVQQTLRAYKIRPIGTEGETLNHWVLIDFGGLIVNVFYQPIRELYDLEGIWAGSPLLDIESVEALPVEITPKKSKRLMKDQA